MTAHAVDSRRAWSVALAGAVASGAAFGTVYTFGAFFDAMVDDLDAGRGSTALVFGITLFLFFGFGIVSGPLADRFGPRRLVLGGAACLALGLATTSRVDDVAFGYLTYGLGVGLGGGLIVTPMYSTAGGWFVRRRAMAMAVVATGNGLGTLLLVPFAERLIEASGWRDAYVTLAVLDLVVLVAAGLVLAAPPVPPPPPALARMREVIGLAGFWPMMVTGMLFAVALFTAFGFIVDFATDEGVSSSGAALLVGIVGASSVVGRLGLAALTGRVHVVRLVQLCLAAQPAAFALWFLAGGRYAPLVVFAVLLGISYGGYVSLGPETAAVLFGVAGLGGVMGLLFLSSGVGGLVGPPVAGALADSSDGTGVPIAFAFLVSLVALAVSFLIPAGRPATTS